MSMKINPSITPPPPPDEVGSGQEAAAKAEEPGPVPPGISAEPQPEVVHAPHPEEILVPEANLPAEVLEPYKNPYLNMWCRPMGLYSGNDMLRLFQHGHMIGWHYRNPYSEAGPPPSPADHRPSEDEPRIKPKSKPPVPEVDPAAEQALRAEQLTDEIARRSAQAAKTRPPAERRPQ